MNDLIAENKRLRNIVDELVAALKGLAVHDFGANGWNDSAERYAIKARAALKKLEEK